MDKCTVVAAVTSIGWLVTIIGWFVVNTFTNSRETRKEVRAKIDKINQVVEELINSSSTYFCCGKAGEQNIALSKIYFSAERLSELADRLEKFDSSLEITRKTDELYEAITSDNEFGSKVKWDADLYVEKSQRLALIARQIDTACEQWFSTHYQK